MGLQQAQSAQLKPRGRPTVTALNTFWYVSCRICLLNQFILAEKEMPAPKILRRQKQ